MGFYKEKTIKKLFALSGNLCAFPDSSSPVIDKESGSIVAEICHIKARNPEGARYDEFQSDEQRNAFENLVLMCGSHHKVIDDNPEKYTVELLQKIKNNHMLQHLNDEISDEDETKAVKILIEMAGGISSSIVSSHNQSSGQTANSITNINNYNLASSNTKTENQEVEKPDVKVFFENNEMYVEAHYRPDLTKIIQMKVENNGDKKFTDLQAFVDLEGYQKRFRRIPLTLPFESYELTEFGLARGGKQFFNVLEWSANYPNRINFKSPPKFHPENIITLEANQEVTMVIMILGSINPCIKRFTVYHNNEDLFIEEVDDNNKTQPIISIKHSREMLKNTGSRSRFNK